MNAVTLIKTAHRTLASIPETLILLLARFSIAAIFWTSGQTKIQGFAVDVVAGRFELGWPSFAPSTLFLFREEYALPLIPVEWAATLATLAEHIFPLLLLAGFATRFSALALLIITAVIQLFVYPGAYPTHGVWATVLLLLMTRGAGAVSLDHWLARRCKGY
ncbi:DoxX family protein [Marinobacterium litorale]|uniref:DoxX family protein n=1 Tax=Marinobacterium litorale TaxID=404770 RepID=UPI0004290CD5|nr:DoxX family protein [Marinobacterium litorale]